MCLVCGGEMKRRVWSPRHETNKCGVCAVSIQHFGVGLEYVRNDAPKWSKVPQGCLLVMEGRE